MSRPQNFWSRRLAAVEAEQKAEKAAVEAEELAEQHAELEEKTDAELLEELNLPDPDTMVEGDDFSVFMSKTIPERLRKRALRKLWLSNPVLANVDSLVDYGEDFTDAATVFPDMQTTYQVGKGMLKHVQEMARQAEEKAKAAALEETEDSPTDDTEATDDERLTTEQTDDPDPHKATALNERDQIQPDNVAEHGETNHQAAPKRRMKFRVEETAA